MRTLFYLFGVATILTSLHKATAEDSFAIVCLVILSTSLLVSSLVPTEERQVEFTITKIIAIGLQIIAAWFFIQSKSLVETLMFPFILQLVSELHSIVKEK